MRAAAELKVLLLLPEARHAAGMADVERRDNVERRKGNQERERSREKGLLIGSSKMIFFFLFFLFDLVFTLTHKKKLPYPRARAVLSLSPN